MKNFNWGKALLIAMVLFMTSTLSIVFYVSSLDFYLVSEDHYEKGVTYQEQIDRKENTRDLKTPVTVELDRNKKLLTLIFPPAEFDSRPEGTVTLYRPSNSSLDREYSLKPDAEGRHQIKTNNLPAGKWLVRITWSSGDREFYKESTIFI